MSASLNGNLTHMKFTLFGAVLGESLLGLTVAAPSASLLMLALAAPSGYQTAFSSLEGCHPGPLPADEGWRSVGASPIIISDPGSPGGQALSIPSNTQLIRGVDAGDAAATVNVSLKPTFGSAAAETTALKLGPVAILFLRDGDAGRVCCLVGSSGTELPVAKSIPLDGQGRSQFAFTVQVSLEATWRTAAVSMDDETIIVDLSYGTFPHSPRALVISAGGAGPVQVNSVEVTSQDAAAITPSAEDPGRAGSD